MKTLLYSTFQGNAATEYGKKMEEEIEKEVCKIYEGVEISHPSLTADSKHKFLAGSPDGIGKHDNETFLLEYKAPYSLFEGEKDAADAQFLCQRDDGISLSKKHNYFYQIQGLLHIFQLPYCILVVAGHSDFVFVRVDRDDVFFRSRMFEQLREFYFRAILPEIVFPMKRRGGLRKKLV